MPVLSLQHRGGDGRLFQREPGRLRRIHAPYRGDVLEVPNGLSSEHAALTEPMAVGYHAVEKARMTSVTRRW